MSCHKTSTRVHLVSVDLPWNVTPERNSIEVYTPPHIDDSSFLLDHVERQRQSRLWRVSYGIMVGFPRGSEGPVVR